MIDIMPVQMDNISLHVRTAVRSRVPVTISLPLPPALRWDVNFCSSGGGGWDVNLFCSGKNGWAGAA